MKVKGRIPRTVYDNIIYDITRAAMVVLIQQEPSVAGAVVGAICVVTVLITSSIVGYTLIDICRH